MFFPTASVFWTVGVPPARREAPFMSAPKSGRDARSPEEHERERSLAALGMTPGGPFFS